MVLLAQENIRSGSDINAGINSSEMAHVASTGYSFCWRSSSHQLPQDQ